MQILVTGGAGFIGSHTTLALLEAGYEVVVVDNLSNSSYESLKRVQKLTHKSFAFFQQDLRDTDKLRQVFSQCSIEGVIHFAGLKAVGESVTNPIHYYDNNIMSTVSLVKAMQEHKVRNLVFSSSATIYGTTDNLPIKESEPAAPQNPYGRTKYTIETFLQDVANSEPGWHIALLRYFNPVGAHPSGMIGEDPFEIPNNLMPYLTQVAVKRRPMLNIFGNDYPTPDGTCIRDYIHVMDLAQGHLATLDKIDKISGCKAYNLGTGKGHSVLEVVNEFSKVTRFEVPHKITSRRPGDAASTYADPHLAHKELGWKAQFDLHTMCQDAWNWQKLNPEGYR